MSAPRLPTRVRLALKATGLPWRIERRRKHDALVLGGRTVCVLSRGPKAFAWWRGEYETAAQVRRVARELNEGRRP